MVTRPSRRRGFSVLMALAALFVVTIAAESVSQILLRDVIGLRTEDRRASLRGLTDAALASTLAHLDADPSYAGLPPRRFGGGIILSTVTTAPEGTVRVLATAERLGERSSVAADVKRTASGLSVAGWKRIRLPVPPGR